MSIPNADQGLLGSLIRLYQAGYGHQPDNAGLEYWYKEAASGATLGKIGNDFVIEAGFDAVAKDAFPVPTPTPEAHTHSRVQTPRAGVLGSTANVPAGEYTITMREVSLVGLDAGQTVASLSANITLV